MPAHRTFVECSGDRPLRGRVRPVSDKSLSHRALIVSALGEGRILLESLNDGADVQSTRRCLEQLGLTVREDREGTHVVGAAGRLRPAPRALDCGNSGTSLRLLAGLLAGQPFTTTLDGDDSLRSRPMGRIARPLRSLGARVEGPTNGERAPLIVTGSPLRDRKLTTEAPSAQVKSALLLAALSGGCAVRVEESIPTRDHTERLFARWGLPCRFGAGWAELDRGGRLLLPERTRIGADPSAAALLTTAALLVPGSRVILDDVLVNGGRTGFFRVLERMGASIRWEASEESGLEASASLRVEEAGSLRPAEVSAAEIPSLVDELPALAAIASLASGSTTFRGVGELRHKESDRLRSTIELLACFGIEALAVGDDLTVQGGALRLPTRVPELSDHRMAMVNCALALGAAARHEGASLRVDATVASISDPSFVTHLLELRRES